MKRIYFDHNATTPTHPDVVKTMLPYYDSLYGNASSIHQFGREAKKAIEESRAGIASLINAKRPDEIVFTSGGSESDNFAIRGVAHALKNKGDHIILSSIEHLAVDNTCKFLEKNGYRVTRIPVDKYGIIDLNALHSAITDRTILITVIYANNETGTIEPLKDIVKIAGEKGVYVHTDAVQAVGKIKVDVEDLGVDLLSLSGHKFYGPKGVGALYIRKGTKITPVQTGGHHEKNRRAGTENVPGIVGIGKAAQLAMKNMDKEARRISGLRDRLQDGIEKSIKQTKLNGHPTDRLPNTCNISFEYLEGESIILNLDMEGVGVSTGSACTSGSLEASHVLLAMGVSAQTAQGSIRFSLGRINTKAEIDYVIEKLPSIIERLRKMSPLYEE
ncbi:MAG: cysteine desulfurase NifS [Candidatus Omnitrophica bacterium]|nr:cysteine desulfurase NifS [Candidatus Omnitrophota bacterium]